MTEIEGQNLKISYDVAEDDFDKFVLAWDLDTDIDTMSIEDADDFNASKRKIIRQIATGRAAVNDDGDIVYTLFAPVGSLSEVTLKRPSGRAYIAMDRAKDGRNVTKFNNLLGASIGQPSTVISRMDGVDVKLLQAVYALFLGS